MTPEQFVTWAEAVFGKYLPAMRAEVVRWMGSHESWFAAGMREVALKEHPSVYGKPPGVSELVHMQTRAYERGHALEAIAAARKGTTLIASEGEEDRVTPEEGLAMIEEVLAKLTRRATVTKG